MARHFAKSGNSIVFTSAGASNYDITFNGIPAELKRLSSHNNIRKEAKSATKDQGAKIVLFNFPTSSPEIHKELNKLSAKGIHGKYYFGKSGKIHDF